MSIATNAKPQPLITKTLIQSTEKSFSNTITETKSPTTIKEQLSVITNQREQSPKNEQILLEKIKQLEEQNSNLNNQLVKSDQEKKELAVKLANSEKLTQAEKQRANYYQQQLKSIAKTLYQ